MSSFFIHPTDTAEWHFLIGEAQARRALRLGEELESYLVFLLSRFSRKPELIVNTLFGKEFLEAHQLAGQARHDVLQALGDKCLVYTGLFPDNAKRHHLSLQYFVGIGQNAYDAAAQFEYQQQERLCGRLAHHFSDLVMVLHAVRDVSRQSELSQYELMAIDLTSLVSKKDHN